MTEAARTPTVRLVFSAVDSARLQVEIDPDVSIGQLQLAGVELAELAREARAGERMRQAQSRLETMALAQQLQTGRRT